MELKTSSPQSLFVGAIFLFIAGTVLLGVAAFLTWRTSAFVSRSVTSEGTVTALEPVRSSGNNTGSEKVDYAPTFTFKTADGRTVSVTSNSSSNPPGFDVGDSVTVLYDPADPHDARIDSVWQVWGVPLLLGGMGLFFFLIGTAFTFTLRYLARQARSASSPV